jgi:2-phosphoglycerate kinase
MLYLIGGPPRCGKTTIAKRLAASLGCSRVPADYLSTAFTNYVPVGDLPTRYPAWNTATIDERYQRYVATEIIENYRTKAATTWPGLRDFLSYALYDQHTMVVEGYQIEPAMVHELQTAHPQFAIRVLFLIKEDRQQLAADLHRSTDPEDWVLRSASLPETFERVATMVGTYSQLYREAAKHYNYPVCVMDGPYEARLVAAMNLLTAPQ